MIRVKILGIGGGGRNTVHYIQQNSIVEADYWMVCSGFCPSEHSFLNHLCLFGEQRFIEDNSSVACEPFVRGGHFNYDLNTLKNRQLIGVVLDDIPEFLVLVVGLSGRSGATITEFICNIAKEKNIPTIIVATLPYEFEGEKRIIKAQQQLNHLNQLEVPIHVIPANNVFEKYPNTNIHTSFPNLDKVVSGDIYEIIEDYEHNLSTCPNKTNGVKRMDVIR